MSFRVRVLRRARQDADAIVDWIGNVRQSPQGAQSWLQAYERAAAKLRDAPHRHGFAPENEHVPIELRQFLFKTRRGRRYRGIFTIDGNEVLILRIRGPGQPLLQPDEIE